MKKESLWKAAGMVFGIDKGAASEKGEPMRFVPVLPPKDSALAVGWGGGQLSKDSIVMELLSKRSSRLNGNGKSS